MIFDDKEHIAKVIKLARKKSGLTQEKLSENIGISSKQLSRIEMGEYIPSVPTFLRLIDVLKINLEDFGINLNQSKNNVQNEFIKLIFQLSENELNFYHNLIKTAKDNQYLLEK